MEVVISRTGDRENQIARGGLRPVGNMDGRRKEETSEKRMRRRIYPRKMENKSGREERGRERGERGMFRGEGASAILIALRSSRALGVETLRKRKEKAKERDCE